jgi:hypothetical protein
VNSTNLRMRGILFIILGLSGVAAALLNPEWHLPGVGVGFVFLFLAGTAFSKATQIATSLRPFVKQSLRVEVWGLPLPGSSEGIFEIDSISAIGVGLLIYLRATSGGPRSLLKVAQPRSARLEEGRIEITEAAYVSWAGTKLKAAVGKKMAALVLLRRPNPGFNPRPAT